MEIQIKDKYLTAEAVKNDDIVEFLDEGEINEMKDKFTNLMKNVYNFTVGIGDRRMIYTPGEKHLKEFKKAWGNDSKSWIGQQFKVKIVTMLIQGNEKEVIRPIILNKPKVAFEGVNTS